MKRQMAQTSVCERLLSKHRGTRAGLAVGQRAVKRKIIGSDQRVERFPVPREGPEVGVDTLARPELPCIPAVPYENVVLGCVDAKHPRPMVVDKPVVFSK